MRIIAQMKRFALLSVLLLRMGTAVGGLFYQQSELPRRIENPETIRLPGGSRVEFGSFHAVSLSGKSSYSIFLPPSYDQLDPGDEMPVVYLLHGMWNDHTSWVVERYGSIANRVERLILAGEVPECLIVSPDGQNSFYTDYLDGSMKFEEFIHRDLVKLIESRYKASRERRNRAIAGVSMGGYGALKIAMKYPELFASVAAISPIVFTGSDPSAPIMNSTSRSARYFQSALKPVYGMPFEPEHWRRNSLEVLARTADLKDLNIYFSFGTADRYNRVFPLQKGIETLSRILSERNIPHQFEVVEGGPHGWSLVKEQLEKVFLFVTQTFR
jgi:enterochelin esterase family protein